MKIISIVDYWLSFTVQTSNLPRIHLNNSYFQLFHLSHAHEQILGSFFLISYLSHET